MKWTMATAILAAASASAGSMILEQGQKATISAYHNSAVLRGNSEATVAAGGYVDTVAALDSSSLDIRAGVVLILTAGSESAVSIRGGSVGHLYAMDSSTVTVYGYWFHSYEQHMFEDGDVSTGWPGWLRWTTGWPEGHIDHMMYVADRSAASTIRLVTTADLPIPEPAAAALVAVGFLGIFLRRAGRRRIM